MRTHSTALSAAPQSTVPVLDIGSLPLQLEDLTRERIKALPKPALQELLVLLAEMDSGVEHAREQLTAALDDLYGEAVRAQLLEAGKDTGTARLWDSGLSIYRKEKPGETHAFNAVELIGEIAISQFAGFVAFQLCEVAQFGSVVTAALVGISGHMGGQAIYHLERWAQTRLGKARS